MPLIRRRFGVSAAASGALLTALLLVLALAPGGGASPANTSATTGCKFSGKRFVGKTSQNKRLCFTLTADGKKLREYAYDYKVKCKQSGGVIQLTTSGGSIRTTFQKPSALKSDGTFSSTGSSGFFKGKVGTSSASGTLRNRSTQQVPASVTPPITYVTAACDSGLIRWSARKTSG